MSPTMPTFSIHRAPNHIGLLLSHWVTEHLTSDFSSNEIDEILFCIDLSSDRIYRARFYVTGELLSML